MSVDKSRKAALDMLTAVMKNSETVMDIEQEMTKGLSAQDAAFAKAILISTIRNYGALNTVLDSYMKKPLKQNGRERFIMLMGLSQLICLDGVDDHAAIHTTVELMKKANLHLSSLCNGVLRSIQRAGITADQLEAPQNAFPKWIVNKITQQYGDDAQTILEAMALPATVDIRVRDTSITLPDTCVAHTVMPNAYRLTKGKPSDIDGWSNGSAIVQNIAAQIPVHLLKDQITIDGPLMDMCAAPGGKTIQLMDLYPSRQTIAVEKNHKRIPVLNDNLLRCGHTADIHAADALNLPFTDQHFASIVLDAPCSAIGTTRQNPDVIFNRKEDTLKGTLDLQHQLLIKAGNLLKVNGVMVYAVCSLFKEEGDMQIETFLKNNANFKRVPVQASELGEHSELITPQGDVRTLPQFNMDSFFVCRLKRIS